MAKAPVCKELACPRMKEDVCICCVLWLYLQMPFIGFLLLVVAVASLLFRGLFQKLIIFCLYRQGYQMFGVTLSFIATHSGLLRWQDHNRHPTGDGGQSAPWVIFIVCISFLMIKPTRCTNFSNLLWKWYSTCFRQCLCPSSAVIHCTHSSGVCHIEISKVGKSC
jgi:hypothetical protein